MSVRRRKNGAATEESTKSRAVKAITKQRKRSSRIGQHLLRFAGIAVLASVVYLFYAKRVYSGEGVDEILVSNVVDEQSVLKVAVEDEVDYRDMFEVADIPGKGKGLVATRDINQGELVIKEKPLFVVPNSLSGGISPAMVIAGKLGQLPAWDSERFMNLSYVNLPEDVNAEEQPEEVALAIFQTNSVALDAHETGIFPQMARLNHGCSSAFNVVYNWRSKEEVLVVHALKKVKKGEELLTAYLNTKRPRSERREVLQQNYGFECSCSVCSLSEEESKASDGRLIELTDMYNRLASWARKEIEGAEAIETVRKMWRIGEAEGYWSERGRLAADATFVAAAHSDAPATQEWAQLAADWYSYEIGKDSKQVAEMQGIVAQPESHPGWGLRANDTIVVGGLVV